MIVLKSAKMKELNRICTSIILKENFLSNYKTNQNLWSCLVLLEFGGIRIERHCSKAEYELTSITTEKFKIDVTLDIKQTPNRLKNSDRKDIFLKNTTFMFEP